MMLTSCLCELKVNMGVEASLIQLLDTGLLHADPHPGNVRYTPEGRMGYIKKTHVLCAFSL